MKIAQAAIIFVVSFGTWIGAAWAQSATAGAARPASTPARAQPAGSSPAPAASRAASAASAPVPSNPIVSTYKAEKVVKDKKGREKLEPLKSLAPGDVILYTGFYQNTGAYNLLDVDLGVAIPQGTRLVAGSLKPDTGELRSQAGGAQQVVWRMAVLETGTTQTVTMRLTVPLPAPAAASSSASATGTSTR